ncbi:MAG: hypothetical protein DMG67_15865 [Acidobacteria bacterium]|nr:MAG: hypothetical protein DMG67_15865 [Acidobacteriota bacterium]
MYAAVPGLKILREAGMKSVREKSKRQTDRLVSLADHCGWKVNAPRDPERRGGTVAIEMPRSKEVCEMLLKRGILVDWRPHVGVRMSPHFYNRDEELDFAMAAVNEILESMRVTASSKR